VGKPKHLFRRIEVVKLKNNEPISFITNIENLTAADITELYKRKWDKGGFVRNNDCINIINRL
jgi:hypothetical protein